MQTVNIEPFHIVGIKVRTKNHTENTIKDIGGLWEKFMTQGIKDKIPNRIGEEIYALYTNYESDHNAPYDFIIGCKVSTVSDLPEGFTSHEVEGGNYNETIAKGNITEGLLYNAWLEIWEKNWDRKYTTDFEVYGAKAINPADAEVSVFVAINS